MCIDRFVSNKEKDLYVVGVDKGDKLELPDNATIQVKVTRVLDWRPLANCPPKIEF